MPILRHKSHYPNLRCPGFFRCLKGSVSYTVKECPPLVSRPFRLFMHQVKEASYQASLAEPKNLMAEPKNLLWAIAPGGLALTLIGGFMESSEEFVSRLSALLQEGLISGEDTPLIKGFYVVAEFETFTGEDGLFCVAGTPNGEGPAPWTVKGWLHEALDKSYLGMDYDD